MITVQAWQSGETVGHCNLRLARGSAYGVMPYILKTRYDNRTGMAVLYLKNPL